MASILYSNYLKHLEELQRFEKKENTPPFLMMFGLAFFLHMVVLLIWSFIPETYYFNIPKSELTLSSGGTYEGALKSQLDDRTKAVKDQLSARRAEILKKREQKEAAHKAKREAAMARAKVAREIRTEAVKHKQAPAESLASTRTAMPVPDLAVLPWKGTVRSSESPAASPTALASTLAGAAPTGAVSTSPTPSDAAVAAVQAKVAQEKAMARYEQQLSSWIDRHKIYPYEAQEKKLAGKVLLRLRIDRAGNVKIIRIQQSSGHPILDKSVISAAKRANPVPAVPASYPGGNLLEFIIAINFKS